MIKIKEVLREKLLSLPETSGVYLMKDKDNNIIYVGKAKNLKRRVNSYFINNSKNAKTWALVDHVFNFDYILTASELDALVLENNLIKKHQPKYNILLKDAKTFPYIKINTKENYPKIEITRKVKKDGAKYFGPYFAGITIREVVDLINSAFSLKKCTLKLNPNKSQKRACLNYSMGLCNAPCINKVSPEEYNKEVDKVIAFLKGDTQEIEKNLISKMETCAENLQFERAIEIKQQLKVLERLKHKFTTQFTTFEEGDFIGLYSDGKNACISIMFVRDKKLLGGENFVLIDNVGDIALAVSSFISQYYTTNKFIPKTIFVDENIDTKLLEEFLTEKAGSKVQIIVTQKGTKNKIIDIAKENAREYLEKSLGAEKLKQHRTLGAIERLKEVLSLKSTPKRMECFDISHISGTHKVASMTVFINGEPAKNHYRKFIIKTVEGNNDFASLQEALTRRLNELKNSTDISFGSTPNLIIIDGGKGQLSSVLEIFQEKAKDNENINAIDLISIAEREEELFTTQNNTPIVLKKSDIALQVVERIRDEAHRFAITFHRLKRGKNMIKSVLSEIEGIGPVKQKALIKHFGALENIENATIEELTQVEGITQNLAIKIKQKLKNDK